METGVDWEEFESDPRSLWVTDAELIRRMGVPEKVARQALRELDRNPASMFPQKKKTWGDRRYWPAVLDYFSQTECRASKMPAPPVRRVG
jgi:hypothetical protein